MTGTFGSLCVSINVSCVPLKQQYVSFIMAEIVAVCALRIRQFKLIKWHCVEDFQSLMWNLLLTNINIKYTHSLINYHAQRLSFPNWMKYAVSGEWDKACMTLCTLIHIIHLGICDSIRNRTFSEIILSPIGHIYWFSKSRCSLSV